MIQKIDRHVFRILGSIIWLCGFLLPWFTYNFEPQTPSGLLAGWEDILIGFSTAVEKLKDGYDANIPVFLLEGVSVILLAVYVIYIVFAIKKEFKGSKLFGVLLAGIVIVNVLYMQIVVTDRILLGFWMFITGLLLCIIVEWMDG